MWWCACLLRADKNMPPREVAAIRAALRAVECRENDVMREEDDVARAERGAQVLAPAMEDACQRTSVAAAKLKGAPDRLGLEQVLRAAEDAQLQAELAVGRIQAAKSRSLARRAVMSWRLGRARQGLLTLLISPENKRQSAPRRRSS